MTDVIKKRKQRHGDDNGGRAWRDTFTSQGMPRIAGSHQKLEDSKEGCLVEPLKRTWPCSHLDFNF